MAATLMDSYDCEENDDAVIDYDKVEYDFSDSERWYTSEEFNKECLAGYAVNAVYFNGENVIAFDFHVN